MDQWYYNKKLCGLPIGPISGPDLKRAANRGDVTPDTLVWMTGWSEWHPASKVPKLFGLGVRDDRGHGLREPPEVTYAGRMFAKEIEPYHATLFDCPRCNRAHFVDCGPCPSEQEALREVVMAERVAA